MAIRYLITLCLTLFFCLSLQAKEFGNLTISTIESIYDGDTFRVTISGLHPVIEDRIAVRVRGVNAPEIRSIDTNEKAKARQAKQFIVAILRSANIIELRNISRGKYFRLIADVYADGINIGQELLNKQLAVPY